MISDHSLDYPDEIFNFFVESGLNGVGFNIEEVEGVNEDSSIDRERGEARVRTFLERILELNRKSGFKLRIREFEIARENILQPQGNRGANGAFYNLETNPLNMVNVDCYGNFSSFSPELLGQETEKYKSFTFGNLNEETLFEGTQKENFKNIVEDIDSGNKKCAESCDYWVYCGGASPSNKYYENGTFDSSETTHCRCMIQMPMEIVLEDIEKQFGVK